MLCPPPPNKTHTHAEPRHGSSAVQAPALVVRALPSTFTPGQPAAASSKDGQPSPSSSTTPYAPARRPVAEALPAASLRTSLDSAMPRGSASQPSAAPLHSSAGAAPSVPGAYSMVIAAPASAASYSIALDTRHLHPGASFLAAALEQSLVGSVAHGGHLIASASAAGAGGGGGPGGRGQGRLHYSAHMTAAERGMHLVARAKRSVLHPSAAAGLGEAMMQRQLSPGHMYGTAMYGERFFLRVRARGGCALQAGVLRSG